MTTVENLTPEQARQLQQLVNEARAQAVTELLEYGAWLVEARRQYTGVGQETAAAQNLLDILAERYDGYGWVPSWLWDELDERKPQVLVDAAKLDQHPAAGR